MTTHTPGPWKAGAMSVGTDEGDDSQGICCMIDRRDYTEHAANARLIAAAPDLLMACRVALNVLTKSPTSWGTAEEAARVVEAAIAHAETERSSANV